MAKIVCCFYCFLISLFSFSAYALTKAEADKLYEQSLLHASANNFQSAIKGLEYIVQHYPWRVDAQIDLAIFLCRNGDLARSQFQWDTVISLTNENQALIALKNAVLANDCKITESIANIPSWASYSVGMQDNPINQPIDLQQTILIGGMAETVKIDQDSYQRSVPFKQLEASINIDSYKQLYFWGRDYEQGVAQRYMGFWQQIIPVNALNAHVFYQLSRFQLDKETQIQRSLLGFRVPITQNRRLLFEASVAKSLYEDRDQENGTIRSLGLHWVASERLQFAFSQWLDEPERNRQYGERNGQEFAGFYRIHWQSLVQQFKLHWWRLSDSGAVSPFIGQSRAGDGIKLQWEVSYPLSNRLDALLHASRTEYLDRVNLFSFQDHSLILGVKVYW